MTPKQGLDTKAKLIAAIIEDLERATAFPYDRARTEAALSYAYQLERLIMEGK